MHQTRRRVRTGDKPHTRNLDTDLDVPGLQRRDENAGLRKPNMTPQLRFRLPDEEREIERLMLDRSCSRDEAIRRLAVREKRNGPKAEPRSEERRVGKECRSR